MQPSKNESNINSLQNSALILENIANINESDFYEALNMPLQMKENTSLNYAT